MTLHHDNIVSHGEKHPLPQVLTQHDNQCHHHHDQTLHNPDMGLCTVHCTIIRVITMHRVTLRGTFSPSGLQPSCQRCQTSLSGGLAPEDILIISGGLFAPEDKELMI